MKPLALIVVAILTAAACSGGSGDGDDAGPDAAETADVGGVLLGVSSPFVDDQPLESRLLRLEREVVGREFGAVRLYHAWDETFPFPGEVFLDGRDTVPILSISTQRVDGTWVPWSEIADAADDSAIAGQLAAWGAAVGAWDGPIMVSLDHEPDFYRNGGDGDPVDYVAAYRRFATVMREAAPDAQLLWIGVAFFFSGDADTDADDYYPGDDVVDVIGADGFNWSVCRDDPGTWRGFDDIFAAFRDWANERPDKPVVLAEVGSVEDLDDPQRKAEWLRDAADRMAEWDALVAVMFWDNVHENDVACDFRLDSGAASARAFQAIAARPTFVG